MLRGAKRYAPDITMKEYRYIWKAHYAEQVEQMKGTTIEDFNVLWVLDFWPAINMQRIQGKTDHEVASDTERHYVGAHQYGS